jgi:hypothetical protein
VTASANRWPPLLRRTVGPREIVLCLPQHEASLATLAARPEQCPELGEDARPASADQLQDSTAWFEAVVDDGQLAPRLLLSTATTASANKAHARLRAGSVLLVRSLWLAALSCPW